MATINVEIVSAEGHIFSGEANMVFAPARGGDVGIAPRHAPMLADLRPGELRVDVVDGDEQFFYITGGLLEVQPHLVTVLADTALRGEQLDEEVAKIAKDAAEAAVSAAWRQAKPRACPSAIGGSCSALPRCAEAKR